MTTAYPRVIATNATPKRVFVASGERSPYMRSTNGTRNASEARSTKAAIPTLSTAIPPAAEMP